MVSKADRDEPSYVKGLVLNRAYFYYVNIYKCLIYLLVYE